MSASTIRALVAVDSTIDPRTVELVVDDPHIQVVGVIDQDSGPAEPAAADVLLVACGDASAETLEFVASARQRGGHPVVVVCGGNPNGFVADVLSSGADDIVPSRTTPRPARRRTSPCRRPWPGGRRPRRGRRTAASYASSARRAGSARR